MTDHQTTTISKLFHDRERIEDTLRKLGRGLEQLKDEGRTGSRDFRECAGHFSDLSNRLVAIDKQIGKANAVNDGDRYIVAMVQQWRQEGLDCTIPIAPAVNLDW
jgi:hypothetical protein